MKNLTTLIIIAVALIAFLIGRASVQQSHEVVYTKGVAMKGSATISLPTKEIQPIQPILPYRYIFIDNKEKEVVDTAKIISNYMAERTYSLTLFDNLHGKLDIAPTIQYNKLTAVPFSFTPIKKTVYSRQKWTFFSTLSYNTFNIAGVGAGAFYNNIGVHYRYLWNTDLNVGGHEMGVGVIF
ncbi:MAG: hypothetical protein PHI32_04530 [Dysgonamonadaceae bacterium]|nr:hypothetical protein [Dysgonamonadaceae bacterium]MDD4727721.1 hypothetical protein [Dysgonamonadaceae bacterium]